MTYKHTQIGWLMLAFFVGVAILFQFLPAPRSSPPVAFPIFVFVALAAWTLTFTGLVRSLATAVKGPAHASL